MISVKQFLKDLSVKSLISNNDYDSGSAPLVRIKYK